MIEILQGSLGSGKSAVATAMAMLHLKQGGVVACNFSLVEGWASEVANHSWLCKFLPDRAFEHATSLYGRFHRVNSLAAIKKLDPKRDAIGRHKVEEGKYSEGAGLLILDECQLIFNSRKWERNMEWIQFFTQSRKLGWNVILIAHTIEMVDAQIRPLLEYESRFRNVQKIKIPVVGLPLSPFPLFIKIRRYAGLGAGASVVCDRDLFPLPLWAARLYDSLEVFSAEGWGHDDEPQFCGSPPRPPVSYAGTYREPLRLRRPGMDCRCLVGPHWDDYLQTIPGGGA